jgi:diguanylate cyclase (GGDEF)-like protein
MERAIQSEPAWQFGLAAQMSLDGFWHYDVPAGRVHYSARWQSNLGFAARDFTAGLEHWTDRVHPRDQTAVLSEVRALLRGHTSALHSEHRVRDLSGKWRWVTVRAQAEATASAGGLVTRIAGVMTDDTRLKAIDALTGLPNRQSFIDHLEARIETAIVSGNWNFAVVSLLLEQFKQVNERLGYAGGDALLIEITRRLTAVIAASPGAQSSVIARLSGAEFLLAIENVRDDNQAIEGARALLRGVHQPFDWEGRRLLPTVVLGITRATSRSHRTDDLMHEADTALIEARAAALPQNFVCYSSGMRERARARHQTLTDLDLAIREGRLIFHYQPEVDLHTRRIVGFEALVRWDHPERGLIPPHEFMALAEETGLIHELGDWGLKEACRQIVEWNVLAAAPGVDGGQLASAAIRVSVNLSAGEFGRPGLVERIAGLLASFGVVPSALCLEVTESSLMLHTEAALPTMRALRALGVGLHMDDFGTGYSSLNYLNRFPFDTLKIDRSFIRSLFDFRGSSEIVRAVIQLAGSLGMDVVAEGIETGEQLGHLQALGCPLGQGYLFARPMPAKEVSALLQSKATPGSPVPIREGWSLQAPDPVTYSL